LPLDRRPPLSLWPFRSPNRCFIRIANFALGVGVYDDRTAEITDIRALSGQPSPFPNSGDSTTSRSGHRHPARSAMLKHELDKPAPPPVAEGIAAIAKNRNLGHKLPNKHLVAAPDRLRLRVALLEKSSRRTGCRSDRCTIRRMLVQQGRCVRWHCASALLRIARSTRSMW